MRKKRDCVPLSLISMLPTHLMQPYGVSSQWPFSHFFASSTTPWPRPRALIQLTPLLR